MTRTESKPLPFLLRLVPHSGRSSALQAQGQIVNLFGVEDLIVTFEKLSNGSPMDLHLGAADANRSVTDRIVAIDRLVEDFNPFDADGRDGIQVNSHSECFATGTDLLRKKNRARSASGDHQIPAFQRFGTIGRRGGGHGLQFGRWILGPDQLANRFRTGNLTRTDTDMSADTGQQQCRPLSDGARTAKNQRIAGTDIHMSHRSANGGGGRGVRTVGVEHHGYAQAGARHDIFDLGQNLLARIHIRSADEDGGAVQFIRTAREDRTMHQAFHLLNLNVAVSEDTISAGIDRDHAIEYRRLRIGVELNEDFGLVHDYSKCRSRLSADERKAASGSNELFLKWMRRFLLGDDLVDLRLIAHGTLDGQFRGFVVVLVDLAVVGRVPVNEHAADDHILVGLVLGNDPCRDAVGHSASHGRLSRPEHLNRLLGAFDRHLGDHHRRRLANQVRRDDRQQARVAGALVGQRIGKCRADRAILVADEQVDVRYFVAIANQCFANVHSHEVFLLGEFREWEKTRDGEDYINAIGESNRFPADVSSFEFRVAARLLTCEITQMRAELTDEVRDLLALTLVPGLGPRLTAALLERFGSASAAVQASEYDLGQVTHIGAKLARSFAEALRTIDVGAEIGLIERFGVHLAALKSAEYPRSLATIADPPHLLYVRGEFQPADANAIAIVGSRQCTPYGKRITERLAADLARAGFTITSGLARGIDAAAHRGALDAGGRTIAVLAGGLSRIYPPEHEDFAKEIEARGALLAETPMAMQPQRGMFHARNRLISGLSRAVIIVEANDHSGALITARHAAEQGREVFAVPANVDSTSSAGTLRLLRQGARLVRNADDVLEDLQGISVPALPRDNREAEQELPPKVVTKTKPAGMDPIPASIWDFLDEAKHIDEITRAVNLPISELARLLTTMELKKWIRRLPGNQYERRG